MHVSVRMRLGLGEHHWRYGTKEDLRERRTDAEQDRRREPVRDAFCTAMKQRSNGYFVNLSQRSRLRPDEVSVGAYVPDVTL